MVWDDDGDDDDELRVDSERRRLDHIYLATFELSHILVGRTLSSYSKTIARWWVDWTFLRLQKYVSNSGDRNIHLARAEESHDLVLCVSTSLGVSSLWVFRSPVRGFCVVFYCVSACDCMCICIVVDICIFYLQIINLTQVFNCFKQNCMLTYMRQI